MAFEVAVLVLGRNTPSGSLACSDPPRTSCSHRRAQSTERRGTVVLFGGDDRNGPKGDAWEYDGGAWSRLVTPGPTPSPRTNARLAYDGKRGTTILYGGFARQTVFGDAWELDGRTWRLLSQDGPRRFLHGFAVDPVQRCWITYGGSATAPSSTPPPAVGETWTFDRDGWRLWTGQGPGVRDHVTLAYDAARGRTVLYGGFLAGEPSAETWEWDGRAWFLVRTKGGPGNRSYSAMVYDDRRRRVLLFGGFDVTGPYNDLWEWDGVRWLRIG